MKNCWQYRPMRESPLDAKQGCLTARDVFTHLRCTETSHVAHRVRNRAFVGANGPDQSGGAGFAVLLTPS